MNPRLSAANELQYIYSIVRKLKHVPRSRGSLNASVFPRVFLLSLLEARLATLDEFADELASRLFKRLRKKRVGQDHEELSSKMNERYPIPIDRELPWPPNCPELDEYFHHSLYYLHDYLLDIDWHEFDIEDMSESDSEYVMSKLKYINNFFLFQKIFSTIRNKSSPTLKPSRSASPPKSQAATSPGKKPGSAGRTIKSSLASGRSESAGLRRRRVRFRDSPPNDGRHNLVYGSQIHNRVLKDYQSILALEMLAYAMNLFVQALVNHLKAWSTSRSPAATVATNLRDSLAWLKESKQKIRTNQLETLARQIKSSNDVHLTVLVHLANMSKIYMIDYTLGILCARDSERLRSHHKSPRIETFISKIEIDVEQKLLAHLANNCLQFLFDMIISEINLPPVELNTETKRKSKEEMVKSRENYLNFISSWLNVDKIVFGSWAPKSKRSNESFTKNVNKQLQDVSRDVKKTTQATKNSTLATGGQFKSSSRILAQMDNLNKLMRDVLDELLSRLSSPRHESYFIALIRAGVEKSFEIASTQLLTQLVAAERSGGAKKLKSVDSHSNMAGGSQIDLGMLAENIDSIASKIRCLKLIHIISSFDRLIKEAAIRGKVELKDIDSLETKLVQFSEQCVRQSKA